MKHDVTGRKNVKDFYNATASEWAETWYSNETMLPLLQKFIALFHHNPRILDAGCGAGYESMRLANLHADVVGIDISEASIDIARIQNPACRFEVLDCRQLDGRLGEFDGIVALALIVHITDDELRLVFGNFRKVIKTKGYLFVAFVEGDGLSGKRSYVEVNGEMYNRAFYLHRKNQVIDMAKSVGFEFINEWFLEESESVGQWKYLLFQAE